MDNRDINPHQQVQQIFLPCVFNEEHNRFEPIIQPPLFQIPQEQIQAQESPNQVIYKQLNRPGYQFHQPTVITKIVSPPMEARDLDSPYSDLTPSPNLSPDLYGNKKKRSSRTYTNSTWNKEEDELLLQLVGIHKNQWTKIADLINSQFYNGMKLRTSRTVRERWMNHINPDLKSNLLCRREMVVIRGYYFIKVVEKPAQQMKCHCEKFGRTENQVRNQFKSLMKKWQSKYPDQSQEELVDLVIQDKQFKMNYSPQVLQHPKLKSESPTNNVMKNGSLNDFTYQENQQTAKKSQVHSFNPKIMVSQKSLQKQEKLNKQSQMIANSLKQCTLKESKEELKVSVYNKGNEMNSNNQFQGENGSQNEFYDSTYNQPIPGSSYDDFDIFY